MPGTAQPLPSLSLALRSDHRNTILPNLSYPSRPNAHIPWAGSPTPLLFAKTTRQVTIAAYTPNVQASPTADIGLDTCSVPEAFQGISVLIWHNLTMIIRKLKVIRRRLFGIGTTTPPAANV